jgi:hypothetical protein
LADPVAWLENAATNAMGRPIALDQWQRRAMEDDDRELLMLTARQVGKSFTCAGKGAHAVAANPRSTWLIIAPTQRQSTRLFRLSRSFLRGGGARIVESRATDLVLARISHQVARLVRIVGWSGARVHGAHVGMAGFRRRLEFQR